MDFRLDEAKLRKYLKEMEKELNSQIQAFNKNENIAVIQARNKVCLCYIYKFKLRNYIIYISNRNIYILLFIRNIHIHATHIKNLLFIIKRLFN